MLIHLVAAGSTADAWIHKSSCNSTAILIISNEEMRDITDIVIFVEDSVILSKGVRKTKKNKAREQQGGFISMLLDTFDATLLGEIFVSLAGEVIIRAGDGVIQAGRGAFIAG